MLAGVSSEADKCRMMPDGTFTQIDDRPAASAALAPHGSAPMRACRVYSARVAVGRMLVLGGCLCERQDGSRPCAQSTWSAECVGDIICYQWCG